MLILEALRAKHGDALLLHFGTAADPRLAVVDGGPPGVYAAALRPRLEELRAERTVGDEPLELDLVMVSHIDDDHIAGLLQWLREIRTRIADGDPVPWRIRRFWHNAFDDLTGNDEVRVGTTGSGVDAASLGDLLAHGPSSLLASVGQGRQLRDALRALGLDGNPPFGGLVRAGVAPVRIGALELRVVAPLARELAALQEDWNRKIVPLLARERTAAERARIADYVDKSVYNLSSMVVLAEAAGRRLLLTGDGRGDHTLEALEAAGLLAPAGALEVDLLKVPHHGSDRDVEPDYFERIRARHYVISADGRHGNPDLETLAMLSAARPDDAFTLHFATPLSGFHDQEVARAIADFLAGERAAGRRYEVREPEEDRPLRVVLEP